MSNTGQRTRLVRPLDFLVVSDHAENLGMAPCIAEANATYLNNIGDAELRTLWRDPDFDPELPAVYYARVLEIPTPNWQAYDQKFYGITIPRDVPLSHQERAYTSPIWYTRGSSR